MESFQDLKGWPEYEIHLGNTDLLIQGNLGLGQLLPESETPPASYWGYQMISWHSHHKQEHNSQHHGKMPHLDFETFPAQLYPISESMYSQRVSLKRDMVPVTFLCSP